jgi:urease accessory protein
MAERLATMHTDPASIRLRLLQLFDSQFPIGAFAHSGGLESYGQHGADLQALRELLRNQIDLGWGRSELVAASLAWEAADGCGRDERLNRLSAIVGSYKVVPSMRQASERLGRQTLRLARRLYPEPLASLDIRPPHHAVAVGAIGRLLDLPRRDLLLSFAHSQAAGSVAAATRCMPISPEQAQELLVELQSSLGSAVEIAIEASEDLLFTSTPALDVRCHQQQSLHTRLFQS